MIFLVGVLAGVVGHKYAGRKYRSNFDGGQVITKSTDIQRLIEPNTIFGIDLSRIPEKLIGSRSELIKVLNT